MRKLILFSIVIFFSLTISKTLLVPEEFFNIQQAVIVAQNGDTVSVNFGRPNGQRIKVSGQRIMGTEITFELRGGEKERLLDILNSTNNQPNTNRNRFNSSWTRQQMVNEPDLIPDVMDDVRNLAFDNLGNPCVTWTGWAQNGERADWVYYSHWNGNTWEREQFVHSSFPSTHLFKASTTVDGNNTPWISFDQPDSLGYDDILYTKWNGSEWDTVKKVNLPDSTEYDFSAEISYGGGEIWIVWYGGPIDNPPIYRVYASHWDGNSWEPEVCISPVGYWFCHIAVNDSGIPHVIYGKCGIPWAIYYTTNIGGIWTEPQIIHDTNIVAGGWLGWPGSYIDLDTSGLPYVVFMGSYRGENDLDIFFTRFDGENWMPAVKVNIDDTLYDDYYPSVAASSPNNIWVGWSKGITWRAFTRHNDGGSWSNEEILDDSTISYSNMPPHIGMNQDGTPWAVWEGKPVGMPGQSDIYSSRYVSVGTEEAKSICSSPSFNGTIFNPNPFTDKISLSFFLKMPENVEVAIFNLCGQKVKTLANAQREKGLYTAIWDGRDKDGKKVPNGIYVCSIKSRNLNEIKLLILVR
jgi:hypothetical protein